ncbi:spore germination protein [Bacillus rubiinfantis]|uniref:spore germination protein n=1 Tax=Bacillus rubiinfantis TaxID=1499680 RepID=UPI000AE02C8C|nr:spore germination protein [Bacillus rubiinfantis]
MFILSKLVKKKQQRKGNDNYRQQSDPSEPSQLLIQRDIHENIARIKQELGYSSDLVVKEITLCDSIHGAIVFIDGLVDSQIINEFILESFKGNLNVTKPDYFQYFAEKAVALGSTSTITNWSNLYASLLAGNTIILLDGYNKAISGDTQGGEKRAISEPTQQLSIRGPKDAFTENIRTNTALIRRRIKSPNLWTESVKLGAVTQTDVDIMYIKGIANDKIVEEVRTRVKRINIDSIIDSGYVEQLIEDKTFTIFPTTFHTERPDVVSSQLLEGRVAIVVDGSPFVLTVPAIFVQFFQAPDDYYSRFDLSTSIRLLRILAFIIALIGPSLYIAGTTYHQEMIPTTLVIAIAAQRENIPFPAFFEALIMEVTFEILREAGLRLPRAVGQAVSIVGALVIGQAAVQASIVSPVMVIVVSITAIANFSTPVFAMAISARLFRFVLMILAAFLGFFGIMVGLMMVTIHLCSLRSFGVPYMSPLAPYIGANQQDVFIRYPLWAFKKRPKLISKGNIDRTGEKQKPSPPQQDRNFDSQQKGKQK